MEVEVRDAVPSDVAVVASDMRPDDVAEVEASCGLDPLGALARSFAMSDMAWTGTVDGVPVCMFGVAPLSVMGGIGSPWLLGTPKMERVPLTFLRLNREYVARMLERYGHLVNHVDARNRVSIRWLRWLGFHVDENAFPMGPFGAPFHRFEMRREA